MTKRTPLYISDIAAFKANDNGARIAPMSPAPATGNGRIRRFILWAAVAGIGFAGLSYVAPKYFDLVGDRLEAQRVAEHNYNCAHHGAAMNRFYGRDVCEDESLHRENIKTSNGEK